jgi:hypothetical protein
MAKKTPLPRGASINPDVAKGLKFYRARIGSRLRAGGAIRKAFTTKEAAESWIREQIKPVKKIGSEGLTTEQLADARTALELLRGRTSLREAAQEWSHVRAGREVSVLEAIETLEREHIAAKFSLRHRQQTKAKLLRFFDGLTSKHLVALTAEEMVKARDAKDPHGNDPSPAQKITRLRHAAILLNFSLKRGWIEKSPLRSVTRPQMNHKKVEIIAPHQAAALLYHSTQVAPWMAGPLAIKLFAGLRNSELYVLDWEQVRTSIRVEQSKTGKPRTVKISDNLADWLEGHPETGRVWDRKPKVKDRESVWLESLAMVEEAAGFKLPQNALRHSYGSYYSHLCQSDEATAKQMGNSPAVVKNNYSEAVTDEETKIFWEIDTFNCEKLMTPPSAPAKKARKKSHRGPLPSRRREMILD